MRLIFVCVVLLAVCFGEKPNSNGHAATVTKNVALTKSALAKSNSNDTLDEDTDTEEVVFVTQSFTVNVFMTVEPTADDISKMEEALVAKFLEDLTDLEGGAIQSNVRVVITVVDVKSYKIIIVVYVENAPSDDIELLSEAVDTTDELITYVTSNSESYSFNVTADITSITVDAPAYITPSSSPSLSPSASPPAASPSGSPAAADDDDDGLSDGALVGIILGVGVGGVGLASVACYLIYGKKKEKDEYVESNMADATL